MSSTRNLARFWVAVFTMLATFLVVPAVAFGAPPLNDQWRNAFGIGELPFTKTQDPGGAHAGGEPQPSCTGSGATVWYKFTPSSNAALLATTLGATDYDTVLAVYTRDGNSWGEVACNDDTQGTTRSLVQFGAAAGVTYYFQIGAFGGQQQKLQEGVTLQFNLDLF
jgi:hypothetical protein